MGHKKPKTLLDRAKSLRYLCDPECYGRCQECPADVMNELIKRLEELEEQTTHTNGGNTHGT